MPLRVPGNNPAARHTQGPYAWPSENATRDHTVPAIRDVHAVE